MNTKQITMLKKIVVKGCIPALLIVGFICGLTYKPQAEAKLSPRGKKVIGVLVGAAAMGATAGAAGGAKWVPLGLFGGGLAGGLIAKGSLDEKGKKLESKKRKLEEKLQRTTNKAEQERIKKQLGNVTQKLQQYKR